ncbi:MAG TPA: hypothetical protein VFW40_01300 [Capsulimonadaceae bacterium]|nr:hypothetical protein [Capsulimonadaceae bacterium]
MSQQEAGEDDHHDRKDGLKAGVFARNDWTCHAISRFCCESTPAENFGSFPKTTLRRGGR